MRVKPEKQKFLTAAQATEWARSAHLLYLQALVTEANWNCDELVFHGGTSLHLSWASERHSEDLDFLLSRQVGNLDVVSARVQRSLREHFVALDPEFAVNIRDKTRNGDRMAVYEIVVSNPKYRNNVMVKAEFWRVDGEYLKKYPSELRTPAVHGAVVASVSAPVPAASLHAAYADKLTAFASRPYVKWRDIYDLWWIGTQTKTTLDIEEVVRQFAHNVSAYTPCDDRTPAEALRQVVQSNTPADLVKKADTDLQRWLPPAVWERHKRTGAIEQMVDYTLYSLECVASFLEDPDFDAANDSDCDLKRIPRGG